MQFDVIDTSCAAFGVMIGDVDVDADGEVVGKGVGDCMALCVFFICFLLIVDFSKLQGVCK